jgi:hypothetical protein
MAETDEDACNHEMMHHNIRERDDDEEYDDEDAEKDEQIHAEEDEIDETNDSDDDDTISKLNDDDVAFEESHIDDDYEDIIARVQMEEDRLMTDLHRNAPPEHIKKGRCDLNIDQNCIRFFKDARNSSNFEIYLGQRRESKQSIESAMIHAAQFASYAKLKLPSLKTISTAQELIITISQKHPMICHQHFDFLQQIHNLKASTVVARIDSITLLYEWMRLNSNDIHIFRDVS